MDRLEKNNSVIKEFRANQGVCSGFAIMEFFVEYEQTTAASGREIPVFSISAVRLV